MNFAATIADLVKSNPFISGGASVAILAFCVNWLRALPQRLWANFLTRITRTVRIYETDSLYIYFDGYFRSSTATFRHSIGKLSFNGEDLRTESALLIPNEGTYKWAVFEKSLLHITKHRPRQNSRPGGPNMSDILAAMEPDYYIISAFTFDQNVFERYLQRIIDENVARRQEQSWIDILRNDRQRWEQLGSVRRRPLPSVITRENIQQQIVDDITKFYASEKEYSNLGIPYHRGYLLHGPPGNGKSSIVHVVASELKKPITLLDLTEVESDTDLSKLLIQASRTLLLIEDVDCLFVQRENEKELKVTFSGLLNALDGLATPHGLVFFMTTNHKNKIDPALVRAGRADKEFYIGDADSSQIERMFQKFYPGAPMIQAVQFAKTFREETVSMASVQGLLLGYKDDPDRALQSRTAEMNKWVGVQPCTSTIAAGAQLYE